MVNISKKFFWIFLATIFLILVGGFFYIFSPAKDSPKRIGILLYHQTPTTINFLEGFHESLNEQGYYQGKNLYLYTENLGDTQRPLAKILKKFEKQQIDLVITTGKDLTVAVAHKIENKPVIFALVTDPIRDETIKTFIDKEQNITGVSYFTPYDRTLDLSKRIIPGLKKLTVILCEGYGWQDLDKLKMAAKDAGIILTITEVPSNKVPDAIINLTGNTDAIYLPNEVRLVMQRDLIQKALMKAKLPAISNNLSFQYSSVLTYFADPETIGEITGRMAVKIFHGANTAYMPAELSSYFKLVINQQLLKQLKISINEDVLSYANEVLR
jgi:ABC-type uncharacterized transport system, periplasmic component